MKNLVDDDALIQAAKLVGESMRTFLPDPDSCECDLSPEFELRMKKLTARVNMRHSIHVAAKRAAIFAMIAFFGFSTWLALDVDARAGFFSWAKEIYEESVVYQFFGELGPDADALPDYTIGWLPDGYEQTDEIKQDRLTVKVYSDLSQKTSGEISLKCIIMTDGTMVEFLEPDMKWESVNINEINGEFYKSPDATETNELIWFDESTGIAFELSSFLEKTDMLRIAESVYSSE